MVAKLPRVGGSSPVRMSFALEEAAVTWSWFLNLRQPKILCNLSVSKVVRFSLMDLVLDGRTGGSFVMSSWSLPRRFGDSGEEDAARISSSVGSLRILGCLAWI